MYAKQAAPTLAYRCERFDRVGSYLKTRRTCHLPETERSWAPIHLKEFSMTTTHFDQLQLAERWGLSPKTLERWRVIGTGPKYIRLPGKVIYRLCDIEAYENECLVSSTAEYREIGKLTRQADCQECANTN